MVESQAYRADVDGLRAVAVTAVITFHAWPSLLPGGFVGVDVFFVISGFLIGGILLSGLDNNRFSLREFYIRRARRIFPALAIVLAATAAIGWCVLLPNEYAALGEDILASAAFVQNVALWREAGYFDQAADTKPLLHLWSLAVEEQFYLAFPLSLWAAWRLRINLLATIFVCAIVSFALNIMSMETQRTAAFFLPHTRVWELLAGSALAYLGLHHPRLTLPARIGNAAAASGAILLALSFVLIPTGGAFPGWLALAPVGGTLLLIAAGPAAWINRALSAKPVVFLGLISYPLYLWHWPLLSFARIMEGRDLPLWIASGAIALSFVLAAMTYLIVERPIRRMAVSLRLAGATIGGLIVVGAAGVAAASDRLPQPVRPQALHAIALQDWGADKQNRPGCEARRPVSQGGFCVDTPNETPDILVLGDSHANAAFYGLEPLLRAQGHRPLQIGRGGCAPLIDVETYLPGEADVCREIVNRQIDYAVSDPTIQTIFLGARWAYYQSGWGFSVDDRGEGRIIAFRDMRPNPDWRAGQPAIFAAALRETVSRLVASGKTIVLLYDWPELHDYANTCVDARPVRLQRRTIGLPAHCVLPRAEAMSRQAAYRALFAEIAIAYPSVRFLDPLDAICDQQECVAIDGDGRLLYRDDDHLSIYGAEMVAQHLLGATSRPAP